MDSVRIEAASKATGIPEAQIREAVSQGLVRGTPVDPYDARRRCQWVEASDLIRWAATIRTKEPKA